MPHLNIKTGVLFYNSKYLNIWVAQEEHGKVISFKREHMTCLNHAAHSDGHKAFKMDYNVC
jgi:hypothetical protein